MAVINNLKFCPNKYGTVECTRPQLEQRIAELEAQLVEAKSGWDSAIADLREAAKICKEVEDKLEGKWISVEEVIPDDEGPVIVHIPDWSSHRVDVGFYRRNVSTQSEYWMVRSMKAPVTHWQPLPPAPKEATK